VSEESDGLDAIAASSCSGACGGDWDGDAPRVEGVSMTGKWRQDGQSAAHRERLRWISVLRTLRFGRDGTPGPFFSSMQTCDVSYAARKILVIRGAHLTEENSGLFCA
jgi:hypothetical protein